MKAVILEVPEHFLSERRLRGDDSRDEMWEGVLHMVPAPLSPHQYLQAELLGEFRPAAKAQGLIGTAESALYRPGHEDTDYRCPDLVYCRREHWKRRGVEARAELVVEVRSPGDESYEKVPFYVEMGCQEILIIDRDDLKLELWRRADKLPAAEGYDLESLGVRIERLGGPRLAVTWQGGRTVITPLDV